LKDKDMKTLLRVGLGLLLVAFAGSNAYATSTVTVQWAPNHSPTGGEFILQTSDIGTFNSFCLEVDEHVSIGGTYNYSTSDSAQLGGANTDLGDPISLGAAWLYSQFAAGTLATLYGYDSATDQTDLQNAIWMLEDELLSTDERYSLTNPWLDVAGTALFGPGWTLTQLQVNANGAYGVNVMNLYTTDTNLPAQDMLHVPDGGTTLALLGLAITGLGLFSKRRHWPARRND
jgi:VPDSG-CTERM motif